MFMLMAKEFSILILRLGFRYPVTDCERLKCRMQIRSITHLGLHSFPQRKINASVRKAAVADNTCPSVHLSISQSIPHILSQSASQSVSQSVSQARRQAQPVQVESPHVMLMWMPL